MDFQQSRYYFVCRIQLSRLFHLVISPLFKFKISVFCSPALSLTSITYSPSTNLNLLAMGSVRGLIMLYDTQSLTSQLMLFSRLKMVIEKLVFIQNGPSSVGLAIAGWLHRGTRRRCSVCGCACVRNVRTGATWVPFLANGMASGRSAGRIVNEKSMPEDGKNLRIHPIQVNNLQVEPSLTVAVSCRSEAPLHLQATGENAVLAWKWPSRVRFPNC
jgi:hypothetical protein